MSNSLYVSPQTLPSKVVRRGYRLHITKRSDWWDARTGPPITRAEFNQHFRGGPQGHGLMYLSHVRLRLWITPHTPMDVVFFVRPGGEIVGGLPPQARMPAIVEAARAIGARVVGDDGEEYGPETPLPVEEPKQTWAKVYERIEWRARVAFVIAAWLGAIAMGVWGVIYFFGYT